MIVEPLEWVREQGIVLQSARGPVPNLAEYVAGEPIRGSWWGHAAGHEIFAVLSGVLNSPDVIATRLVPKERLAAVDEEHTASGAHRTIEIPFPDWVPAQEITAARLLSVDDALAQLPACLR